MGRISERTCSVFVFDGFVATNFLCGFSVSLSLSLSLAPKLFFSSGEMGRSEMTHALPGPDGA